MVNYYMGRRAKKDLIPVPFGQKEIGKQLSSIRKARGLTQLELADKIGLTRTVITDYERGRCRIHDVMIVKLAIALDVEPNDILCYKTGKIVDIIPDLRYMKRVKRLEKLKPAQQKLILHSLDLLLKGFEEENQKS